MRTNTSVELTSWRSWTFVDRFLQKFRAAATVVIDESFTRHFCGSHNPLKSIDPRPGEIHRVILKLPDLLDWVGKGCAVKNWTTFERVYFNNGMEQTKKKLTNSVALRKRWAIYKRVKTPLSAACLTFVRRPRNAFRKSPTSMFLAFQWSLIFSWSIFDASQLPAYTACFRLPKKKKRSSGRSWGTFGGSEVLNVLCYAPEGASSTCCLLFRAGEATWAFFLLWNVMPSSLKASVLVTVEIPHPVEI